MDTLPARGLAPPRQVPSLEQTVDVETPEQVVLSYTVAGIGSRAAAVFVDVLIVFLSHATVMMLLNWAAREFGASDPDSSTPWITTGRIVAQFALLWGYFVLFEALNDGQTPGKRWIGLRVVRDGGYSVTFGSSAIRNLVRVIDMQPGVFYFVGMVSAIISKSGKRLGDMAAGTLVVQERAITVRVPAAPRADGAAVQPARLPDDVYALLARFADRASDLDDDRRRALQGAVLERVQPHILDHRLVNEHDLRRLLAAERAARAHGAAAPSDTGASREQHALVAAALPRWHRFAARVTQAQKGRGLASLGETDVALFVAEYRQLSADLARLRTASRGRPSDELFYVSRLVAAGHNLLYRRRELPLHEIWRFVRIGAPAAIVRAWRPVALAALFLFAPMLWTYVELVRNPAQWEWMISDGMRERVEQGLERPREGAAYLPPDEAGIRGPILASAITTNNVRVTYVAFAGGITAGLATAAMLTWNGASIGSIIGYYDANGLVQQILGFIAPHGVLELFAICVAGGGGFLLASAILTPGARTRREALVENGRRAIAMIGAATALLFVAGLIEGTISPNPWPNRVKYAASATTAVALLAWLIAGVRHVRFERAADVAARAALDASGQASATAPRAA